MALQLKKTPKSADSKWVEFDEDTKILLVGTDNPAYQVALERARRRLRNNDSRFGEGDVGIVDGEKTENETQAMLLGNFIVKDWSGVLDEEGNTLNYEPQIAADIMLADPAFFLFVLKEAGKIADEAKKELVETVGKPSPASSGKKNGPGKAKSESSSTAA